jgi:hypothetical protein
MRYLVKDIFKLGETRNITVKKTEMHSHVHCKLPSIWEDSTADLLYLQKNLDVCMPFKHWQHTSTPRLTAVH